MMHNTGRGPCLVLRTTAGGIVCEGTLDGILGTLDGFLGTLDVEVDTLDGILGTLDGFLGTLELGYVNECAQRDSNP
ncbi:hypothetical protein [Gordonia sp. NPDC003429]